MGCGGEEGRLRVGGVLGEAGGQAVPSTADADAALAVISRHEPRSCARRRLRARDKRLHVLDLRSFF